MIKCKQLIRFNCCSPPWMPKGAKTSIVVKFLNQLERVDELRISLQDCKFEIELKPKFTWKKLNLWLSCRTYDDFAVQSLKALCKASTQNSCAAINVEKNLVKLGELYRVFINTCVISELQLDSKLPSKLNLVRIMPETLKFQVNMRLLKDEQLPTLLQKLPNVKHLYLNSAPINLSEETIELDHPFFDQITHLKGNLRDIHKLKFKYLVNLTVTLVETVETYYAYDWPVGIARLKTFCLPNPTLKLLKVHLYGKEDDFLSCKELILSLYNELKGSIEKCTIIKFGFHSSSELQTFEKLFNEDQRRFFVFPISEYTKARDQKIKGTILKA